MSATDSTVNKSLVMNISLIHCSQYSNLCIASKRTLTHY